MHYLIFHCTLLAKLCTPPPTTLLSICYKLFVKAEGQAECASNSSESPTGAHCEQWKVKVKVEFILEQATKAQNRGIALLFLYIGFRWGGWSTPRLGRFTPGKDPVPIVLEAGWDPGPVWRGAENLASTGIRSPDRPACRESLHRLKQPGPRTMRDLRRNGGLRVKSCEVFRSVMVYDSVNTTDCRPAIPLDLHSTNWILTDGDSEARQPKSTA